MAVRTSRVFDGGDLITTISTTYSRTRLCTTHNDAMVELECKGLETSKLLRPTECQLRSHWLELPLHCYHVEELRSDRLRYKLGWVPALPPSSRIVDKTLCSRCLFSFSFLSFFLLQYLSLLSPPHDQQPQIDF